MLFVSVQFKKNIHIHQRTKKFWIKTESIAITKFFCKNEKQYHDKQKVKGSNKKKQNSKPYLIKSIHMNEKN